MTQEAQRIAIAEACGLYDVSRDDGDLWASCARQFICSWKTRNAGQLTERWYGRLPDYPADLNAMHEAEKVLRSDIQRDRYTRLLMETCDDVFPLWHATAAQRAEAFLRTLNLWEDSK